MKSKKKGLGRGLEDVLFSKDWFKGEELQIFSCSVDRIRPNPHQPRRCVKDEAFEELVRSIRTSGILQPIVVSAEGEEGSYRIVAGERRWRAAREAGLQEVPVVVRETTGAEALQLALVENIQRQDLNCIEEARAYMRLQKEFGLSQSSIAEKVGKKRATVANLMRLLTLPPDLQQDLLDGRLTMGHARALLALKDPERQRELRNRIVAGGLSVRETERLVAADSVSKRSGDQRPTSWKSLEELLRRKLESRVQVRKKGEQGTITIRFRNRDELQRILATWNLSLEGIGDESVSRRHG